MEDYLDPYVEQSLMEYKKPSVKQVSMLYMITVLLFLVVGSRVQIRELYSGILITEFLLVMLPSLYLLYVKKYNFRYVLRLNPVKISTFLIVFGIMVFVIPVIGVFNLINMSIIEQIFGKVIINQPPIETDPTGLLVGMLVIAGSAGICEEVLFRGVIQRGFERLGAVRSIIISAFLFGLMHVDFQKLLGTFLLGCLIGFIVYRTNSIFAGIFAHFCNNALALILAYISSKFIEMAESSGINTGGADAANVEFSSLFEMPQAQLMAVIVFWGMVFLTCVTVLILLFKALIKNTAGRAELIVNMRQRSDLAGVIWLLPPVFLIGLIYIYQGFGLLGIKVSFLEIMLEIMGIK